MAASDWLTHAVPLDDFDVEGLLEREWLCTNGTAAYAMGTAAGCNTRRYHGLFIATTHPPVGRVVALNQVLESLLLFDVPTDQRRGDTPVQQTLDFTTLQFADAKTGRRMLEPSGWSMLRRFDRRVSVMWVYGWGRLRLQRELRLHWQRQAATVRYRFTGLHKHAASGLLKLSPMLTLRDFHALFRRDAVGEDPIAWRAHPERDSAVIFSQGGQAVTIDVPGARWVGDPQWWYGVRYPVDAERGQDDREDLRVPGRFEVDISGPKADVELTVSLGTDWAEAVVSSDARAAHLSPMLATLGERLGGDGGVVPSDYGRPEASSADADLQAPVPDRLLRSLAIAADDFVVGRAVQGERLSTVLAGYPWFADWGRDTFIALPGLLLTTGRFDEASRVLRAFARNIQRGLLPNKFSDYEQESAQYNTVDASMWYVHAALAYLEASGDDAAWRGWLAAACVSILDAYEHGTDHGIGMRDDGLVAAGSSGTQLTWMDAAATNGRGEYVVFTPRHGKAVEINALWHANLRGMAGALRGVDDAKAAHFGGLADRAKAAYTHAFWNADAGCLYDHLRPDGSRDASIRPNQVFAAALEHSPLDDAHRAQVVAAVRRHLLTPAGLRTLPVDDARYHGRYTGPAFERDEAYHQGTAWPWLIGGYAEAALRAGGFSREAKEHAWQTVRPLVDRLLGDGLGQLHEVHEADPPHRPVGCIAQAWSVAELVRVLALIQRGG